MSTLTPEALLEILLWVVMILGLQLMGLILTGAWLQIRRERYNAFRIACLQRWEHEVIDFAFSGDSDPGAFRGLSPRERKLLIPFLIRVLGTLAGAEGEAVRGLYRRLDLERGIAARLRSRFPKERALAVLEVGCFGLESHWEDLRPLLQDPVPHVAHAAARSLAGTGALRYAEEVLDWVLAQEDFQQERLLWILEAYGGAFLEWLGARMDALDEADSRLRVLYALLAASTRHGDSLDRLVDMLQSDELEVLAAAIKALGALGTPEALPGVLAHAEHPEWVVRAQVAKVLGVLGGATTVPILLRLLEDPVFDVRRNAALSLTQASQAGQAALAWVAQDPMADPFARDLALEQLQWNRGGGLA